MRQELDKYGIQMPTFSKIGGILANEVSYGCCKKFKVSLFSQLQKAGFLMSGSRVLYIKPHKLGGKVSTQLIHYPMGIFLKTLILCEGTKRFTVHMMHIMTQPFSLSVNLCCKQK